MVDSMQKIRGGGASCHSPFPTETEGDLLLTLVLLSRVGGTWRGGHGRLIVDRIRILDIGWLGGWRGKSRGWRRIAFSVGSVCDRSRASLKDIGSLYVRFVLSISKKG